MYTLNIVFINKNKLVKCKIIQNISYIIGYNLQKYSMHRLFHLSHNLVNNFLYSCSYSFIKNIVF
jgi:hypothetical protein